MVFKLANKTLDQNIYVYKSFILNIHWDDVRVQHLQAIGKVCEDVIREYGTTSSISLLRGSVNVDLSAETRKAAEVLVARTHPYTTAQAIVIESNGFLASVARSVITGINLVTRAKFHQRVFQDPREGAEWLFALPALTPDLRASFPQLWPHIQELLARHACAESRQARLAG